MIPSYNYAHYLPEAVISAATQQGVDVDVVIVDNGSTDTSVAVATALAAEYRNVRVVVYPANGGIITSFNRCRREVTGEFAMLLCADDALTPGSLARGAKALAANPDVGMVYGPCLDFSQRGDVTDEQLNVAEGTPIHYRGDEWIERRCRAGNNPLRNPEALMRSSVLDEVGLLEVALPFTSDLNMWLRIADVSNLMFLPGPPQALYRKHSSSFGAQYLRESVSAADVQARWEAFRLFFDGSRSPQAASWEQLARQQLAAEARYGAARAYRPDPQVDAQLEQFRHLVTELEPQGSGATDGVVWDLRRRLGPRISQWFPPFLAERAVHKARHVLSERRRERVGV